MSAHNRSIFLFADIVHYCPIDTSVVDFLHIVSSGESQFRIDLRFEHLPPVEQMKMTDFHEFDVKNGR